VLSDYWLQHKPNVTLEKLVELAFDVEHMLDRKMKQPTVQSLVTQIQSELPAVPPEPIAVIAQQPKHYTSRRCFNCVQEGHTARDCKNAAYCAICNRLGHTTRKCRQNPQNTGNSDRRGKPSHRQGNTSRGSRDDTVDRMWTSY